MKDSTRSYYEDAVLRAIATIRDGLDEALDLEALATLAALAPLHFHRIFRGLVGETPLAMHRRLRLERAAASLATTDEPVTRIALLAGYETHESFTRAFHAAFAASPRELRAAARRPATPWTTSARLALAAPSGIHADSPRAQVPRLQRAGDDFASSMRVTVEDLPARRVLARAHRGPYTAISEAFVALHDIAGAAGLHALPGLELVALYHDDPDLVPARELRSDAGLVVPDGPDRIIAPRGLHEVRLPAGLHARALHRGPYAELQDAWSRLMGGWLVASGHRVGEGPAYERYVNTPEDTPPEELVTELYLSLA